MAALSELGIDPSITLHERRMRNRKIAAGVGLTLTLAGIIALANTEINSQNLQDNSVLVKSPAQEKILKSESNNDFYSAFKEDVFTLASGVFTVTMAGSLLREANKKGNKSR